MEKQNLLSRSRTWAHFRKSKITVFLAVFLAVAVRISLDHSTYINEQGDYKEYVALTRNFLDKGYYGISSQPDFKFPPVYPLTLVAFTSLFFDNQISQATFFRLNLLVDTLSILLLLAIGFRLAGAYALPGLFFMVVNPCWYGAVNVAVSEPLALFLFLGFLYLWTRNPSLKGKEALFAGLFIGALGSTRAMYLWFPVIIVVSERYVWVPIIKRVIPKATPQKFILEGRSLGRFLGGAYVFPVLWAIRNFVTFGIFSVGQSENGIKMAYVFTKMPVLDFKIQALSDQFRSLPLIQQMIAAQGNPDATRAVYAAMRAETLSFIWNNPWTYFLRALKNPLYMWIEGWARPFPYTYVPEYLGGVFMWGFAVPVILLGAVGLARQTQLLLRSPFSPEHAVKLRAIWIQLLLVSFVTVLTAPLSTEPRYCAIPFVMFSIWMGFAFFQDKEATQ